MLSNIREVRKCKTVTRKNYKIDDFTRDMILLLPKSPKSFVHILTMALSDVFQFTESEVHSSIDTMTKAITEDVLKAQLSNITSTPVVELSQRPEIKPEVLEFLNNNDVHIAMILARHLYGDLSETNNEQKKLSEAALESSSGSYVTHFKYQARSVSVETLFPECNSTICLI
ncbi:hypothetical protein FYL99_RS20045 [Escherichia coli]|nr:hypothetical protein [Escherichia coli]